MLSAFRGAFLGHGQARRIFSFLLIVAILVSALPVTALPAQAAPDSVLSFVQVSAPDINCIFDVDCKITVNDLGSNFTPPAATGDAFLQSRLWPKGEAGTKGAGLYAYLYRIDMRNAVGLSAKACVFEMRIDFGPIVALDYNGDGSVEQGFVVTKGGIGNVKPTSMQQVGPTIIIRFQDPPVCDGSNKGNGDSSFFFGFASKLPHQDVTATLAGSPSMTESLPAWAPKLDPAIHVHIGESNNKHFQAGLLLPAVQLVPVEGSNQQQFTHFLLPGVDPNGNPPGYPDVPVVRRLLAVPHGAVARVANIKVDGVEQIDNLLLYPSQPSPADAPAAQQGDKPPAGVFDNPPFTMNREAYASDQNYPKQVVDITPMGTLRDLDVVQVSIAAGQYDAAKRSLETFDSVDFDIQFAGGDGGFLPRGQGDDPFDKSYDPIYAQALNAAVLQQYPYGSVVGARLCWGSEFLIITNHDLRPAADALRTWKVSRGLSTAVYEMGNGSGQIGNTKEKVRDFIRHQFAFCQVRPAYVLLLGDAELIPTFYRTDGYGDSAGTDIDYSLMNNGDILPDLAYGRMPVDTLDQAQTVVNKIIAYEKTPPFAASFYQNMTIASYFQCCRDDVVQPGTDQRNFIETSELVRNAMLGDGYDAQRIYTDDGGVTPNRYYNGTLLPADLRAGSGFPWNGNTSDITSAINDGRFLVLHRDHGWTDGWGSPSYSTSDLAGLSNGALTPVIYSINCASGLFDNETLDPNAQAWAYPDSAGYVSWAETVLRMKGGAVSVIGDTRVSPTWANSALTRGLFDATWPDTLPLDGGPSSIQRLGDVLNYGKLYLESQVGVAQTAGDVYQSDADTDMILYHVLGDPTLKMWTGNPYRIHFPIYYYEIQIPKPGEWVVKYPVEGATMTALQNGNPIARSPIVKGQVDLKFVHAADPNAPIQLSVTHPDGTGALLGGPDTHGLITPKLGGVVQDEKLQFELRFDPGAVGADTDIFMSSQNLPTQEPLPNGIIAVRTFVLDAFDQGSDGQPQPVTHFDKPYTMILGYDATNLRVAAITASTTTTPTIDPNTLTLQYFDTTAGKWQPVACTLDTAKHQLTCQADHFTEFALTAKAKSSGQELFLPSVSTTK